MGHGRRHDRGNTEWRRIAAAFTVAVESGRLDLPLSGAGATRERWAVFADLAEEDLPLARLGEGHADALAILMAGSDTLDGFPGVTAQPVGARLGELVAVRGAAW